MNFDNTIGAAALSIVTLVVAWTLKKTFSTVAEGLKVVIMTLLQTLTKTLAKVEVLDAKLSDVIQTIGDVHKIRTDLNGFYARLKKLEEKVLEEKN